MTEERVEKLTRYAKKVWYRDIRYRDEPIEDFIQNLLLLALEHEEESPALLLWRLTYQALHKNPYRLRYFSEIENDERYKNGRGVLEMLLQVEEKGFEFEEADSIDELAEMLYEREDLREAFLDYMYGQPCGSYFQRKCRDKVFRRRFEILDNLARLGRIAEREEKRLKMIAEEMTKAPSVKKERVDTSHARAVRAYYERNRDRESARKKAYRARKKAEKQARQAQERANSAKEI